MRVVGPRIHGLLDYVTSAVFLLAPTVLGLSQTAAVVCYGLAVAHLVLTLVTDFPLGVRRQVPYRLHRGVEYVVAVALIVGPWAATDLFEVAARAFFTVVGVVILAVALASGGRRKEGKRKAKGEVRGGAPGPDAAAGPGRESEPGGRPSGERAAGR